MQLVDVISLHDIQYLYQQEILYHLPIPFKTSSNVHPMISVPHLPKLFGRSVKLLPITSTPIQATTYSVHFHRIVWKRMIAPVSFTNIPITITTTNFARIIIVVKASNEGPHRLLIICHKCSLKFRIFSKTRLLPKLIDAAVEIQYLSRKRILYGLSDTVVRC